MNTLYTIRSKTVSSTSFLNTSHLKIEFTDGSFVVIAAKLVVDSGLEPVAEISLS